MKNLQKREMGMRLTVILATVSVLSASSLALAADMQGHLTRRQVEVEKRGIHVMPFDLNKTTHVFDDRPDGGLQTVKVNDQRDAEQIGLIRQHLSQLAVEFHRGDFSTPAKVHGRSMPGLAQLKAADGRLKVRYRAIPTGATLRFFSRDPKVVAAIHQYFAAQRADHAAHGHVMDAHPM